MNQEFRTETIRPTGEVCFIRTWKKWTYENKPIYFQSKWSAGGILQQKTRNRCWCLFSTIASQLVQFPVFSLYYKTSSFHPEGKGKPWSNLTRVWLWVCSSRGYWRSYRSSLLCVMHLQYFQQIFSLGYIFFLCKRILSPQRFENFMPRRVTLSPWNRGG